MKPSIAAVQAMDPAFESYQATVRPGREAVELASQLPRLRKATPVALTKFIKGVQAGMPKRLIHAKNNYTGKIGYVFHIGKAIGRSVVIEVFVDDWNEIRKLLKKLKPLTKITQCRAYNVCSDELKGTTIEVRWK